VGQVFNLRRIVNPPAALGRARHYVLLSITFFARRERIVGQVFRGTPWVRRIVNPPAALGRARHGPGESPHCLRLCHYAGQIVNLRPSGTRPKRPLRRQLSHLPQFQHQIPFPIHVEGRGEPMAPHDLVVPVGVAHQHRLAEGVVVGFDEDQNLRLQPFQVLGGLAPQGLSASMGCTTVQVRGRNSTCSRSSRNTW